MNDLDRQVARATVVLRELRDTLEDLDDRRELARAKKRNAGKRGSDWETVKKELKAEEAKRKNTSELQPLLGDPLNKERRFIPLRLGFKQVGIH